MNQFSTSTTIIAPLEIQPMPQEATKLHVIVVDDVPMIRKHITDILVDTGLVGIIGLAANARTALEVIQQAMPQVVILDIGIPGTIELRDGIDVLKWIKQTLPQIYVVMLTNMSDPVYRVECLRLGAFAFLDKSREFEKLPKVIEKILWLVRAV